MAAFASLDYQALADAKVPLWFVTLTTPESYWDDYKGVYRALRRFRDTLHYEQTPQGYLGAFVRREIGSKRGMLHYHLVVIGGKLDLKDVMLLWSRSLRSDVCVRVDVQSLETPDRVARYLSKYVAKVGYEGKERVKAADASASPEPEASAAEGASLSEAHNVGTGDGSAYTGGRWWYIWGKDTLPWAEVVTVLGDQAKVIAKHFKRIFRKWLVEKAIKREVAQANASIGRGSRYFTTFSVMKSRKWVEKRLSYASYLRRSSTGFTFLLSPDLVQRMLDAACMAVIDSPARFPWEDYA